jgi:hypothetical protein
VVARVQISLIGTEKARAVNKVNPVLVEGNACI